MISCDRGKTWFEPVRLPSVRYTYMGGRPSYLVRRDGLLLLFVHASRQEVHDNAGVTRTESFPIVMASETGGRSWGLLSEVSITPSHPMGIMPYPLQLPDGRILIAVRRQFKGHGMPAYTDVYESADGALTWGFVSRVNDWGAPANLIRLDDERIVCVYGRRFFPYGIRARVSEDDARTWAPELILRDDGGSGDLGYPRTMLQPDGTLVTVYYFNTTDDPVQCNGGVRHIAATRWRPD